MLEFFFFPTVQLFVFLNQNSAAIMIYCDDNTIPITILLILLIITSTSFTVESDIYVQVLPVLKSGLTVFPQRLRSGKKTEA